MRRWAAIGLLLGAVFASLPCPAPAAVAEAGRGLSPPTPALRFVAGAGGVPLLVAEWGKADGPEILLIHGYSMSWQAWRHQLDPALAARYHIVAFDLRGQGGSGKPWRGEDYADAAIWAGDVRAVATAVGFRRPVIVGWSYGGFVAMDYLRTYGSDAVTGIMLVSSLGGLVSMAELGAAPDAFGDAAARGQQMSLDAAENARGEEVFAARLTARPPSPADERMLVRSALAMPVYARRAFFARSFDNRDLVGRLAVPMAFVVGGRDGATPLAPARRLTAHIPGATLTVFPESGHSPFIEEPGRFDRALAAFVDRIWRPAR